MTVVTYYGAVSIVIEVQDLDLVHCFITVVQKVIDPIQSNSTCRMEQIIHSMSFTDPITQSCMHATGGVRQHD